MATSSSSSETSSYEERKEKSILEFCQQDTITITARDSLLYGETYPIWDRDLEISYSERKEFATRLYEKKEEKDAKDRRIIPCHLLRVALIVG